MKVRKKTVIKKIAMYFDVFKIYAGWNNVPLLSREDMEKNYRVDVHVHVKLLQIK